MNLLSLLNKAGKRTAAGGATIKAAERVGASGATEVNGTGKI